MPAGRPRKPTHLHLVDGTRQQSQIAENEPQPERVGSASAFAAPPHVRGEARIVWDQIASLLIGMGVLTVADAIAFERLVLTFIEVRELSADVELWGRTYETRNEAGSIMYRARPEAGMLADADRRLKAYLGDFGLTPSTRSRVSGMPQIDENPADKFFK